MTCGYNDQGTFTRGQLSAGMSAWFGTVLSFRDRSRVFLVGGVVGVVGWSASYARRPTEGRRSVRREQDGR